MTSGSGVFLVDTNVLVYPYDPADPFKRDRAISVLDGLADTGTGVLTAQVLGEFFVTVTRKIKPPMAVAEAERSVANYARSWRVLTLTADRAVEAARGVRRHGLSYWDSLIWATAKHHGIPHVLSEDFSDGARIEGVRFHNPFASAFDMAMLDGQP
jgi:predicted nucleic acid-binding protein